MIDEKKLIDEIKSLSVTITGLGLRAERGVLATFEEEFRKSVLRTIDEQPRVDGWIPCSERLPENDNYILVSFENYTLPDIARYEEDENGGAFYPGDDDKSYASIGLFVNAWQPLPEPYREGDTLCT